MMIGTASSAITREYWGRHLTRELRQKAPQVGMGWHFHAGAVAKMENG
jgi:hypothetical protein